MNHRRRQRSLRLAVLLAVQLAAGTSLLGQQPHQAKLADLIHQLAQLEDGSNVGGDDALEKGLASAPLAEVKANLPALIELTDSPNPRVRGFSLSYLITIEGRQLQGSDYSQIDPRYPALLVPYIPRIASHLTDSSLPARSVTILVLGGLASQRPTPSSLLDILFRALEDPSSTTPPVTPAPDTSRIKPASALGPSIVYVLLRAGSSFYRNPVTHITEGTISPEVQQHVIAFLRRPDQTPAAIAETFQVIATTQAQSTAMNAELLSLFDSPNEPVRYAVLENIQKLRLTSSSYAQAHARVQSLATGSADSERIRVEAQRILPCWNNDRHHPGCSPY